MKRALRRVAHRGDQDHDPALQKIFSHSAFTDGRVDTTFIERTWPSV